MFEYILKKIREKILKLDYVMSLHAEEEMSDGELTILDIEKAILTGKIVERQKERGTGEWKYILKGKTFSGHEIEIVAKLSLSGKLVIITVYLS